MRPLLSSLLPAAILFVGASASAQAPLPAAPYYAAPPPPAYAYPPPPPYGWAPRAMVFADPDERGTERRSPAMMITGFTMTGVGVGGIVTGALFYVAMHSMGHDEVFCIDGPCGGGFSSGPDVGGPIAAMVAGGVLIAVGLPIAIVGSRKKKPETATAVPEVTVGAGSAKLRWAF